jgi:hypothetical protein
MANNIYVTIAKEVGKDVRVVRKVSHHPFDFFAKSMADVNDHRPVRLRYLGVFACKDYWRKGMVRCSEAGYPTTDMEIYAKAPEVKFDKKYMNLKRGWAKNNRFIADDGTVDCDLKEIEWWRPLIVVTES